MDIKGNWSGSRSNLLKLGKKHTIKSGIWFCIGAFCVGRALRNFVVAERLDMGVKTADKIFELMD